MIQFFMSIFYGSINFADLKHHIWTLYLNYNIGGTITSTIASFGIIGAAALIVVGLIFLLYGKKFFGVAKFLMCAGAGYFVGTLVVTPLINTLFAVSPLICGAVCALVMAVFSKFLYNIVLYGSAAIATYVILFANGALPIVLFTQGNMIFSLAGVGVVLLLMLLMRKNIDRLITSFAGACAIVYGVRRIYDFSLLLPGYELWLKLGAVALLAVLGFAFQYHRRRRY